MAADEHTRYEIAYAPDPKRPRTDREGRELAITFVRTDAAIVEEHFAIRWTFVPHPCGEDMFIRVATLDHMPSGLMVYGGVVRTASFKSALAFARAIRSLPIDWGKVGREGVIQGGLAPPRFSEFMRAAASAADMTEEAIDYETWLQEPQPERPDAG